MLTKTVVAEKDVFTGHIGEHRVRPVEHGGFDEDELAAAQIQGIAGLDVDEVPVLMIEAAQDGFPFLGAVNRRIRISRISAGKAPLWSFSLWFMTI